MCFLCLVNQSLQHFMLLTHLTLSFIHVIRLLCCGAINSFISLLPLAFYATLWLLDQAIGRYSLHQYTNPAFAGISFLLRTIGAYNLEFMHIVYYSFVKTGIELYLAITALSSRIMLMKHKCFLRKQLSTDVLLSCISSLRH